MHATPDSLPDPKVMAKALRTALAARGIDIAHGAALEIVAAQHGLESWNVLAARSRDAGGAGSAADAVRLGPACPILRIFDEEQARAFYLGFLGFALDWEHRFEPGLPLYAQVSRSGLVLHLSSHHGDATPGSTAFVRMTGIRTFQLELLAKNYPNARPGVEEEPWGLTMEVADPFGNRLRFSEEKAAL